MNSAKGMLAVVVIAVLGLVGSSALFTVQEQQLALLLRLGEIVDADFKPGLHFKIPVIQDVVKFDKRIQTLDAQPQRFLTVEKKFVEVDSYVKWRINDVAQYYRSTKGSLNTTSRLLAERINAEPGMRAMLVRDRDVYVDHRQRTEAARRQKADLFISVHANSNPNNKAYGTETFVMGLHKSEENLEVAKKENSVITYEEDYQVRYECFKPEDVES